MKVEESESFQECIALAEHDCIKPNQVMLQRRLNQQIQIAVRVSVFYIQGERILLLYKHKLGKAPYPPFGHRPCAISLTSTGYQVLQNIMSLRRTLSSNKARKDPAGPAHSSRFVAVTAFLTRPRIPLTVRMAAPSNLATSSALLNIPCIKKQMWSGLYRQIKAHQLEKMEVMKIKQQYRKRSTFSKPVLSALTQVAGFISCFLIV